MISTTADAPVFDPTTTPSRTTPARRTSGCADEDPGPPRPPTRHLGDLAARDVLPTLRDDETFSNRMASPRRVRVEPRGPPVIRLPGPDGGAEQSPHPQAVSAVFTPPGARATPEVGRSPRSLPEKTFRR